MPRFSRPVAAVGGIVLLAALAVGLWLTLARPADSAPTIARPGAPAPQIALPVVGGGSANLKSERGKVVLLNFWATWCEPCKSEMPALQRLADEWSGQNFVLYSIDLQEDGPSITSFEQQYDLRLTALLDENGDVTRTYGVRALPSTFLIDKEGVLRQQRLGPILSGGPETMWTEAWLTEQVKSLLTAS